MTDRTETAWLLVCIVGALAVLVVWSRWRSRSAPAPAPRETPTPREPPPDDEPEAVCRTRNCTAFATRGLPELVQRRAFGVLVPRWVVVDDPDADVALCRAHHGVWKAHLRRVAVAEGASLEEHLAERHQKLVAYVAAELPKTLALAPPAVPLRPSPLRGATLPPVATAEAPVEPQG